MRKRYASYFILALLLFCLFNLSPSAFSSLQSKMLFAKEALIAEEKLDELTLLKNENMLLKKQFLEINQWIFSEERIKNYLQKIEEVSRETSFKDFYKRRLAALAKLLQRSLYSVEAKVIFRDISAWSSGLWIDKGSEDNQALGYVVIAKNSPVVLGSALVGVIEKVEKHRSYVRLITDASLNPAVRAVRGHRQEEALLSQIDHLEELLKIIGKSPIESLHLLKEDFTNRGISLYLAKGELQGSKTSTFRMPSYTLKGVGFNYEFSDQEGPARGLHDKSKEPLLAQGDLLITSGLDGVFPEGLEVAFVKEIAPLKEGAYAYELHARPVVPNFNTLHTLQILPPLTY